MIFIACGKMKNKVIVSVGREFRFQGMASGVGSPFEREDSFLF
jgi:hypothetical protein